MAQNTGDTIAYAAGERLTIRGNEVDEIYVILKGKIKAMTTYGEYILSPGAIVGFFDAYYGMYLYNYFVEEDCLVKSLRISSVGDITKFFLEQPENLGVFAVMHYRFIASVIKTYVGLSMECRQSIPDFRLSEGINRWELDKFNSLSAMPSKLVVEYNLSNPNIGIGSMYDAARFLSVLNDACMQMADALSINHDFVEPEEEEEEICAIEEMIPEYAVLCDNIEIDRETVLSELDRSLLKLLAYSETGKDFCDRFLNLIETYKNNRNADALSDESRQLRREISKAFYELYFEVFKKAVNSVTLPPIVTMFLNFGYMDETLISEDNLIDLYKIATSPDALCTGDGVFTIYTWLREILWGDKEPSVNGLEETYSDGIRQLKRQGKITAEKEKELLADNMAKVKFEIENLFQTSSRSLCTRPSSFLPVLTDDVITRSFSHMLATAEKVSIGIENIRRKDYSAFYREVSYANKDAGIDREFIMKEVLPDIILLPVVGQNSVMWQDIEGRHRDTPARFVMPIFTTNSVNNILITLTGRFRWEICKRIQGAYWNNLAEKSLTSEYCDYLQFYKRNRDIPEASKAKIKSQLTACRNNFREVFTKDYETWMLYESNDAARLNKVSRAIISRYCPFTAGIRTKLSTNPIFAETFGKVNPDINSKKKHLELLIASLEKKNIPVPNELVEYRKFFDM